MKKFDMSIQKIKNNDPQATISSLMGTNIIDIIQEYTISSKEYIINIDDEIWESFNYRKIYDCLRKAEENDTVRIILNSSGGDLSTFVEIYNLLIDCKAKTIAELYLAYSAAAFLCLSCDEIEIKEFSSMMIHSMSYVNEGKLEEVMASNDFIKKWNEELTHKVLKGFMTQQEIQEVNNGKDYWFLSEEILKRKGKWIPIRRRKNGK